MAVSLLIQALRAPWRQVPWRQAVHAFRPIDPHSGFLPWWTTFLLWQLLTWFLAFRRLSGGLAAPPTGTRAPRGNGGPREGSGDIAGLIKSRAYH